MDLRWLAAALPAFCTLLTAVPAAAQTGGAALVGPVDRLTGPAAPRANAPEFRMPEGDFRQAGEPRRNGLIASVPINRNLEVGFGRFRVIDMARPRTNADHPAATGPRQRSVAGLGFSLRFD